MHAPPRTVPADVAAVFERTLDSVFVADDERRFIFANAAAETLLGVPRAALDGRRIDDFFEVAEGTPLDEVWPRFLETGRARGRVQVRRPDGVRRTAETSSTAHWLPGLHLSIVRDITYHVRAERRLAAQYEVAATLAECATIEDAASRLVGALALALDAAFGTLWLFDRSAHVFRCTGTWRAGEDPAIAELVDFSCGQEFARGQFVPGRVAELGAVLWIPDLAADARVVRAPLALAVGLTAVCAFPIMGPGGVAGVLDFFGRWTDPPDAEAHELMAAACRQVSQFLERRRAEQQLLVTGRIAWHLPVGLVVCRLEDPGDSGSFRLVAANPAAEQIIGGPVGSPGVLLSELFPRLVDTPLPATLAQVVRTGTAADVPEFPSLLPALPEALFSLRIVPLPDRSVGVLFEDITERRQMEQALLEHTQNLEALVANRLDRIRQLEAERTRAEKLAVVGRLAAHVAHEIVNPLSSIKNAFALVKDAVAPDYPHAHYVPRIEREVDRIARIVGEMRELYRPVTEPLRDADMVAVVQDLAALLEPELAGRDVRIRVRAAEWPLYGAIQEAALRQVLLNLLRNAFDASPDGGLIDVVVEATDRTVSFVVADEGPGVSAEQAEHIFEPFFTTKQPTSGVAGLGLGLAIAQGLADAMRGRIVLERGRAAGAVFRLTLPREPGAAGPS